MRKLLIIGLVLLLASCSKEEINPFPCLDGDCNTDFWIDTNVSPGTYQDENGYWHVPYNGLNYFTIEGDLAELHDEYVINNVPLVEVDYDSDYWVVMDSLSFTLPTYSYLGWFTNGDFDIPISIGSYTYTLVDLANNHPPLNIAGYQISKHFCFECPYAETLLGSHSKYTYSPRQQFFVDQRMVSDTLNIFIDTKYNSDIGERIVKETKFKIIID